MQDKSSHQDNKIETDESCKQSELTSLLHDRGHISSSKGTPSSNTVPPQYNPHLNILRFGIDSLYLSYQGALSEESEQRLNLLKDMAQSDDPKCQSQAQLKIGDHLFEVLDKGQKPFAFVLVDNWFRISLSRHTSKSMPLAYVQISSEVLTFHSIDEIVDELNYILNSLASQVSAANTSRVDLFADFVTSHDLDDIDIKQWITRTQLFDKHYMRPQFTGWSIGYNNSLSARLYDKTIEIKKSGKDYLHDLWKKAGWNGEDHVWRLEFQYMRELLGEVDCVPLAKMLANKSALWQFASTDWLRLSTPNPNDTNSSRWATHPLWLSLSNIEWEQAPGAKLVRIRKERAPSDDSLFVNGIAGLTSFMALRGITDLYDGFQQYLREAKRFHDTRGRFTDETFHSYISKKVKEKGRRYNSINNKPKPDKAEQRKQAKDYRDGKDGE